MNFSTSITVDGYTAIVNVPPNSRASRKANSVFCPLGPAFTRAWIILVREDAIRLGTGTHTIVWKTAGELTATRTFSGLYLAKAERLLQGGPDDASSLYLCEFVDGRYLANKHSDTGSIRANIRSYANASDYLTGTSGYTWTSLCEALWTACGVLGAWPGLPFAPDGVPQNQFIIGLNAWQSLCTVLDQLDCAVCHNPLSGTYTIVQLGATQDLGTLNPLRADFQPIQASAADVAAKVRVWSYFHYASYGQERDTELADNWASIGAGDLQDINTGATGAVAGTVKTVWDDLPILLNEINVRANTAAVVARAQARKTRYVLRMEVVAAHKIYGGVQNIVPGGQVRAVLWRNWDDGDTNEYGGTVTEYVSGPDLVCGLDSGDLSRIDFKTAPGAIENFSSPDLGRNTYPNYPRIANIIQVNNDQAQAGDTVQANAGLHSGRVRRWVSGAMATLDPCWILFVDDFDTKAGDIEAKQGDYYGPGRLCGVYTLSGSQRPIYLVRKGGTGDLVRFQLVGIISIASPASREAAAVICNVVGGDWVANGNNITVVDPYELGPGMWDGVSTYQGFALKRPDNKYDIVWMETMARHIRFTADEPISGLADATVPDDGYFLQGRDPRLGGKVDIYDPQLNWFDVVKGAKGGARFNDRESRYEVIYCQRVAIFGKVTLDQQTELEANNDLTTGYEDWEITELGEFVLDPGVPYSFTNDARFRAYPGDTIFVHRTNNEPPFTWRIYNTSSPLARAFLGKTTGVFPKGASIDVDRYLGGVETNTGKKDRVTNKFANVKTDKWVIYIDIDGFHYLIAAECK